MNSFESLKRDDDKVSSGGSQWFILKTILSFEIQLLSSTMFMLLWRYIFSNNIEILPTADTESLQWPMLFCSRLVSILDEWQTFTLLLQVSVCFDVNSRECLWNEIRRRSLISRTKLNPRNALALKLIAKMNRTVASYDQKTWQFKSTRSRTWRIERRHRRHCFYWEKFKSIVFVRLHDGNIQEDFSLRNLVRQNPVSRDRNDTPLFISRLKVNRKQWFMRLFRFLELRQRSSSFYDGRDKDCCFCTLSCKCIHLYNNEGGKCSRDSMVLHK